MRNTKHLTYREHRFLHGHLNRVRHITLDPDGPGVVRIHLVPCHRPDRETPFTAILNGQDILPLNVSWAILLTNLIEALNPYTGKEEILISTFMNVFNIHSNRSPIGGTVEAIYYKPGKFLNADLDKASMENERNAIIIKSDEGPVITCVQIAGLIARRIICHLHIGQEVTRGERFGFIRFGSRVDVYVPLNSEVLVFVGQKVRAADTVLALLNPQEEEKPETPVEAPAVEAVEVTEVAATADAALAAETKTTEEKTQQQA